MVTWIVWVVVPAGRIEPLVGAVIDRVGAAAFTKKVTGVLVGLE